MMEKLTDHKYSLPSVLFGWVVAVLAMIFGFDVSPEQVQTFMSETATSQIAQFGFFFTLAAWVHSTKVKKEIRNNFSGLTDAINKVADSLKEDLKKNSSAIDNLGSRVKNLEEKNGITQGV